MPGVALAVEKSADSYRLNLRAAVRGLWSGALDYFEFFNIVQSAIERAFTQAWHAGAAEYGIGPDELSDVEQQRLLAEIVSERAYIDGFAAAVELHSQRAGGKLTPLLQRAERWVAGYSRIRQLGAAYASRDRKKVWTLHPAEHCFEAGTLILTVNGNKPIENIQKGEYVLTTHGSRRVVKIHRHTHYENMVRIGNAEQSVVCTPNHPFLTPDGWVHAEDMSSYKAVIFEDLVYQFDVHIAFPNTLDKIPTGHQVFVLSLVPAFLLNLSFGQRRKSRMSMPVIPIGLDNQMTDAAIDNKSVFDNTVRFKINTNLGKILKKAQFEFCRVLSRLALASQGQYLPGFLSMVQPIPSHFLNHFGSVHWIVAGHVMGRCAMNRIVINRLIEFYTQAIRCVLNASARYRKFLRNSVGTILAEMLANIIQKFLAFFNVLDAGMGYSGAFPRTPLLASLVDSAAGRIKQFPADGAWDSWLYSILVSTDRPAKFWNRMAGNHPSFYFTAAHNTGKSIKMPGFSISHDCIPLLLTSNVSCNVIPNKHCTVYNLEVEEVNNYFANGFVVHNCNSCLRLSGKVKRASYWIAKGILPKVWSLECRNGCKCTLDDTDLPLSKGPLPAI